MPADRPWTPADRDAVRPYLIGAGDHCGQEGCGYCRDELDAQCDAVLNAVAPPIAARAAAAERVRLAEQMQQVANQAEANWRDTDHNREIIANYRAMADVLARTATTTTEGTDHA